MCRPCATSSRSWSGCTTRRGPSPGTRSGWCAATRTSRCARVGFAVDPVAAVVDEALERGADLLVTHHPLLLRGVHGVPATTFKGRAGASADPRRRRPCSPRTPTPTPPTRACPTRWPGRSTCATCVRWSRVADDPELRPRPGRRAARGRSLQRVRRPRRRRAAGRRAAASASPGDPGRPVRLWRSAAAPGTRFSAPCAAAGADAYVTADLRHHPASEALEAGSFDTPGAGPALVDVAHWASEWPWLADAAARHCVPSSALTGTPTATVLTSRS